MDTQKYMGKSNSHMELGDIYFWIATINNWYHLLKEDSFKEVIIQSLNTLSEKGLIDVFAFVIMPNHIHLIWRINSLNGKETAQGSFSKYTAHTFKKMLKDNNPELLKYAVDAANKKYEFWQRDPLAIPLYRREVMQQKLNYIQLNPLASHWQLANDPSNYYWSSAKYYERNERTFNYLKDIREEF